MYGLFHVFGWFVGLLLLALPLISIIVAITGRQRTKTLEDRLREQERRIRELSAEILELRSGERAAQKQHKGCSVKKPAQMMTPGHIC